jgi:hypothetical protein
MRRPGRERRITHYSPLQSTQRQLLRFLTRDGGALFEADSYQGSSDVTHLVDRISGSRLAFTVAAPLPSASLAFGGKRVMSITTEVCASELAAAAWGYLHKAAGAEFVHVAAIGAGLAADGVLHSTMDVLNTATQAGSWCECVGSNQLTTSIVSNGTGTPANGRIMQTTTTAFAADGVASYVDVSHAAADTPDFTARIRGTSTATGNYAGTAAAGDPPQTLQLFRNWGGTAMQFVGLWACSIFKPVPFTAAERAIVQLYIHQKYGIAP